MTSFTKTLLSFSETNLFAPLVTDYLEGKLSAFHAGEKNLPYDFDAVLQHRIKNNFPHRTLIAKTFAEQNINPSALQKKNIEALLDENTFTVTTGHQLNLFTGPLYFIYKIVSTINLAAKLKEQYPQNNFVPVYWLASEDHDIAEINHTTISGNKIEWHTAQKGAAGKLSCAGIAPLIDEVKKLIGENEHTEKLIALLEKSYAENNSLALATRTFVNGLFAHFGLLILDADAPQLKRLFTDFMKDDVLNHTAQTEVNKTIQQLHELKFESQVHPRAINLFYLAQNFRGRIEQQENKTYTALNSSKQWSQKELLDEIQSHPENFSPNVVLRPLYQEVILPNVAYVGGPAEISYWLQYKSMFEKSGVSFPVLVLRSCAIIFDEASGLRMNKLGLLPSHIFRSYDELAREFTLNNSQNFSTAEEEAVLKRAFDTLSQKISKIDSTLVPSVEASLQKSLNSVQQLSEKVLRAEKRKHETSLQQMLKLKEKLFPAGVAQERVENVLPFMASGGDDFIIQLMHHLNPLEKKFVMLFQQSK